MKVNNASSLSLESLGMTRQVALLLMELTGTLFLILAVKFITHSWHESVK
jgi:hypothetical protein